jgi:uncharacterized damage-inducible protein DinB
VSRKPLHRSLSGAVLPLVLATALILPSREANGQALLDAKSAATLRDQYMADLDTVHVKIMALANAIPEDKYSWRPAPGVRSISEVLMHMAGEWSYYLPGSVGGKPPADFGSPRETLPKLEKITAKKDVIDQLNKSWAYGRAQVIATDPATLTGTLQTWKIPFGTATYGMTGDQHEHLGQLIAYARSVGVKPPWSK